MKRVLRVLCFLGLPVVAHAQLLNHALVASYTDVPAGRRAFAAGPDTIDVLAVMVQFQQDSDERTSGDGQFDLSSVATADIPVDAPPRNAAYFDQHLSFLSSYFRQASKGKVIVRPTLVSQVITLPDVMGRYSPAKSAPNTRVADLARDAWRKVDSLGLVTNFATYDAFIVFHAGIGRDIDLVSALGYDPTPLDIPSLFLGPGAFQDAHGVPGVPVQQGSFSPVLVPNSLVIPETESRSVPGVGGDLFLEYSINGLLCASFGNYLGLPDLFDTKTGLTAIGRFGLMDGQSIFSFSGVFPPEPSAWEKYWLGWIEPIPVQPGSSLLSLPAVALADSIYRVPIGAREYYLIENRNRDPQQNGQRVTMVVNGSTVVRTFARDTTGFNAFDITALSGSVTSVEDYDWSLPGGVDDDGTFYDGGILIWHIDESAIASGLASNSINANAARRGIDLEEADGSQDVGQEYGFLTAGSGSESGTALDFWYLGNSSPINKNTFSATTLPSAVSNDKAIAHVTLEEFSARGPRMSVRVTVGDGQVSSLAGFPKKTGRQLPAHALTIGSFASGVPAIVVTTLNTASSEVRHNAPASTMLPAHVYAWGPDGKPAWRNGASDGRIAVAGSGSFPSGASVTDLNSDGVPDLLLLESGAGTTVRGVSLQDTNADSIADQLFSLPLAGLSGFSPVPQPTLLAAAGERGRIHWLTKDGTLNYSELVLNDSTASVVGINRYASLHSVVITGSDGTVAKRSRFFPNGQVSGDRTISLGHPIAGPAVSAPMGTLAYPAIVTAHLAVATQDGWVYLLTGNLDVVPGFPVRAGNLIGNPPALADLDGDGARDIVVFSEGRIFAWNSVGALLDNFPIVVPAGDTLASPPVVADVNGDRIPDVVGVTRRGLVVAYDRTGKSVAGFPLLAGTGEQSVAVCTSTDSIIVAVASGDDGSVSAWLTGKTQLPVLSARYPWPQYQHDAEHSGLDTTLVAGTPLADTFFPPSRAYNWPNPAYDGKTMIRYYVQEDAEVRITIYDMAGDLVASLNGSGAGGMDNEVTWDLAQVQSGIYFAHIDAAGAGASGSAVVKIAVVK
jgi:hypothetical protein